MKAEYKIPEQNLETLKDKLQKLNKKALKLQVTPITLTEGEKIFEPIWASNKCPRHCFDSRFSKVTETTGRCASCKYEGKPTFQVIVPVTIEGEQPKIAGWEFAATLQHTEGETIFRKVPGFEQTIPTVYRQADPKNCDHCHTLRQRNDTYIVFNGTEFKQVGRNCLRDFLGHANPHQLAEYAEMLIILSEMMGDFEDPEFGGTGRGKRVFDLSDFLKITTGVIACDGWISNAYARKSEGTIESTSSKVSVYYNPPIHGTKARSQWESMIKPWEAAQNEELATKAAEWASNLEDSDNEYLMNLRVVARIGYVEARTFGLAASMISAYKRTVEQEVERQRVKLTSNHIGTIGKREVFSGLTLISVKYFDGMYGTTAMHRFVDGNGNIIVWWASGASTPFEEGKTYTVKATVKSHGDYKEVKQTIVTRVHAIRCDGCRP